VARTHQCNLKGVELEAFNLFKIFKDADGPAIEFEFHAQRNKVRWLRLARHMFAGSLPSTQNPTK
jgi:hypothetical protein